MKTVTFYTPHDHVIETVDADTVDPCTDDTKDFFTYGGTAIVESDNEQSPMITNHNQLSAFL